MPKLQIQLNKLQRKFVENQVSSGKFASPEEYILHLVHEAKNAATREEIDRLLIAGLDSGPGEEVTPEYWSRLKEEWSQEYRKEHKE